jgi:tripartite-type tricarboxylate transporter receptor subunit TctC
MENEREDGHDRMTRRAVLAGAMALPAAARAQGAWPSGNLRIVVPFPAGGSVDTIARLVQPDLQKRLGATILIENRGGASGASGRRRWPRRRRTAIPGSSCSTPTR